VSAVYAPNLCRGGREARYCSGSSAPTARVRFRSPSRRVSPTARFLLASHRTGRADFPHPALGQISRGAFSSAQLWPSRRASLGTLRALLGLSGSRQSPLRLFLEKHSEPGPLPSTVVTRFLGTMGPSDSCARHTLSACSVFTPLAQVSHVAHLPMCTHAAPNIPVDRLSWSIASARRFGLPRSLGGSASTSVISGPAQASLALRPAHSLNLLSRPSSSGLRLRGSPSFTARWLPRCIDNSSGGTFTRWWRCTLMAHPTAIQVRSKRADSAPLERDVLRSGAIKSGKCRFRQVNWLRIFQDRNMFLAGMYFRINTPCLGDILPRSHTASSHLDT
jgi:hypothetical protein